MSDRRADRASRAHLRLDPRARRRLDRPALPRRRPARGDRGPDRQRHPRGHGRRGQAARHRHPGPARRRQDPPARLDPRAGAARGRLLLPGRRPVHQGVLGAGARLDGGAAAAAARRQPQPAGDAADPAGGPGRARRQLPRPGHRGGAADPRGRQGVHRGAPPDRPLAGPDLPGHRAGAGPAGVAAAGGPGRRLLLPDRQRGRPAGPPPLAHQLHQEDPAAARQRGLPAAGAGRARSCSRSTRSTR